MSSLFAPATADPAEVRATTGFIASLLGGVTGLLLLSGEAWRPFALAIVAGIGLVLLASWLSFEVRRYRSGSE